MYLATIAVLLTAAAALTLGALHLRMCFDRHNRAVNSLFVISAFSLSVWAWIEYSLMRTETPARYGEILRWGHLDIWVHGRVANDRLSDQFRGRGKYQLP